MEKLFQNTEHSFKIMERQNVMSYKKQNIYFAEILMLTFFILLLAPNKGKRE